MKTKVISLSSSFFRLERIKAILIFTLMLASFASVRAQNAPMTLEDCINYALNNNIQVQQAALSEESSMLYAEQSKASVLPSVSASVSQNFGWSKSADVQTGEFGSLDGSNSTSYSVNSSVVLFNGDKLKNQIKQSELDLQSSLLYTDVVKESVELNILNAFLQVLYAKESVLNAEKQIEATNEELALSEERMNLGLVSRSDYLQIKSELASEKLTLANAKSQLSTSRVSLMQLMEMSVGDDFSIAAPNMEEILNLGLEPEANAIFQQALGFKPQIKKVEIDLQNAKLNEEIAKASLLPSLSLNAGLSTNYSNALAGFNYTTQLSNKVNPSVGLTLSIPIYQKKQAKTSIGIAQIGIAKAELETINTKNTLRKEIEQAVVDVESAQSKYEANLEKYRAVSQSNDVAAEKFELGLLNSVDYLFEKTNLITTESSLLQSKFNLIFNYKILDFYKGISLTL